MRITPTVLMNQSLGALSDVLARMGKNQRRLATGRDLLAPSDDPAGHAAATRLAARLAATQQFRRQAFAANDRLAGSGAILEALRPLMARAQELAVSAADATKGPNERTAIGTEVNELLEEIVAQANRADDGRYLLGGRETLTAPLSVTRDVNGRITAATWNPRGVDDPVDLAIAQGITVQTSVSGTDVLGDDTDPDFVPTLLISLRDALLANDPEAVRATLDAFSGANTRLGNAGADAGSRLRLVEATLADLDTTEVAARKALSDVTDADIAQVAAELGQQEIAFQAALQATAKAVQPSLLDFLR